MAQIAKSIARWVWVKITPEQTEANRKRWGSSLGKKSGVQRTSKMKSHLEVLEAMNYGHS